MAGNGQMVFDSKLAAREDMAGKLLGIVGAVLMYLVPVVLLSLLYSTAVGLNDEEALQKLSVGKFCLLTAGYLLARLLILQPMAFGLLRHLVDRSKGQESSLMQVTMCFGSVRAYLRAVRTGLCMALYTVLWAIPFVIPIVGAAALYTVMQTDLTGILFYEIVLLVLVGMAAVILRYYGAYVLLAEDETLGVWPAFRRSAAIWKGHKRALLSLVVSFIIWFILVVMTSGIAYVYVYPYLMLSVFHLFESIRPHPQTTTQLDTRGN